MEVLNKNLWQSSSINCREGETDLIGGGTTYFKFVYSFVHVILYQSLVSDYFKFCIYSYKLLYLLCFYRALKMLF